MAKQTKKTSHFKRCKSKDQVDILHDFYMKNGNKRWSKEDINELAAFAKLTTGQVYKWLWDQRNWERKFSISAKSERMGSGVA